MAKDLENTLHYKTEIGNPANATLWCFSSVYFVIVCTCIYTTHFKKYFIHSFREKGREREREGEKHQCVSHVPCIGDLARNPGMCPDWNQTGDPLVRRPAAQSTEPHWPDKPHF